MERWPIQAQSEEQFAQPGRAKGQEQQHNLYSHPDLPIRVDPVHAARKKESREIASTRAPLALQPADRPVGQPQQQRQEWDCPERNYYGH